MVEKFENDCVFFCEKYSDLENALPMIFDLIETGRVSLVYLFWFGDLMSDQTRVLFDSLVKNFPEQCLIFTPSLLGTVNYDASRWRLDDFFGYFSARILQKLSRLVPSSWSDPYHPRMTSMIKGKLSELSIVLGFCFFGFYNRKVIEKLSREFSGLKWIRIPQGAVVTQSIYRQIGSVLDPNLGPVERYFPEFCHAALTTDNLVNNYYESFGLKTDAAKIPIPIGSLRYSLAWLHKLSKIINDAPQLIDLNSQRPTVLFLLTPLHKNVWKDETERAVEVIASYPVNLVVKGFHSNTSIQVPDKDNIYRIEDVTTPELIRRADYVFFIATSAVIEAFMLGKEVLQLSYLHSNQIHFESLDLGLQAKSRDCLHKKMQSISREGTLLCTEEDRMKHLGAVDFLKSTVVTERPSDRFLELFDNDFSISVK